VRRSDDGLDKFYDGTERLWALLIAFVLSGAIILLDNLMGDSLAWRVIGPFFGIAWLMAAWIAVVGGSSLD
jgi:hypothetical protein